MRDWARRRRAPATISMALVVLRVFLTEPMRRDMSFSFAIVAGLAGA